MIYTRSKTMLKKLNSRPTKGPLTLIVMDGVGLGKENEGNAVFSARTPNLDMLMKNYPTLSLKAHGTAVGLPLTTIWVTRR